MSEEYTEMCLGCVFWHRHKPGKNVGYCYSANSEREWVNENMEACEYFEPLYEPEDETEE